MSRESVRTWCIHFSDEFAHNVRHPELIEPGLQVLDREVVSGAGNMNLYAQDAEGNHVVAELKRGIS